MHIIGIKLLTVSFKPNLQKKIHVAAKEIGSLKTQGLIILENLKGGYLDFSHLIELKNIYITEIYMKINTNHQELRIIKLQKKKLNGFP